MDSIPWVGCAFGNVYSSKINILRIGNIPEAFRVQKWITWSLIWIHYVYFYYLFTTNNSLCIFEGGFEVPMIWLCYLLQAFIIEIGLDIRLLDRPQVPFLAPLVKQLDLKLGLIHSTHNVARPLVLVALHQPQLNPHLVSVRVQRDLREYNAINKQKIIPS